MSKEQINQDLRENLRVRIKQAALDYSTSAGVIDIDEKMILAGMITDLIGTAIYILTSMTSMTSKEFGTLCAEQFKKAGNKQSQRRDQRSSQPRRTK